MKHIAAKPADWFSSNIREFSFCRCFFCFEHITRDMHIESCANQSSQGRDIEQDFLDKIPTPPQILDQQNQKTLLAATSDFFDSIKKYKKTIRILFNSSSGSNFAVQIVNHLCNGYIPVGEEMDELTARFTQLYIANGTVGMMREWVNDDFPLSSEKIAEMMYTLSRKISQY